MPPPPSTMVSAPATGTSISDRSKMRQSGHALRSRWTRTFSWLRGRLIAGRQEASTDPWRQPSMKPDSAL